MPIIFPSWRASLQAGLLAAGAVFVLAIGAASVQLAHQTETDYGRVVHTLHVKNTIANLRLSMQRAENALRNYLQTSEAEFFNLYNASTQEAFSNLVQLHLATFENPSQQAAIDAIRPTIVGRQNDWQESLRLHASGNANSAVALLTSASALAASRKLRADLTELDRKEEQLLTTRTGNSALTGKRFLYVNLAGSAAIVLVAFSSMLLIRSSFRQREGARKALQQANSRLEATVAQRTFHLQETNEELRIAGDLLRGAVASIPDAVLVVDQHGKTLLSNPAADELFGTRESVGSEAWRTEYRRFRPDGTPFPPEETPIGKASRGEPVDNLEIILKHPKRQKDVYLLAKGRPILDAAGQMKAAVLVYRDLTEVRETETQLRQLQKTEVIGQLTAGMAHDFNNILTVIIGLTEILAEALPQQPELHEATRTIDEAAQRGAKMIKNLLAFARRQPLQPQSVDIRSLLVEAEALLSSTLGEHIELAVMTKPDVSLAQVDSSQLMTALLNLALNARDAMPKGGRITIEAEDAFLDAEYTALHSEVAVGHYVLLAVSDTGTGIALENLDRVFDPFFTTKKFGDGTGLGLSMVYGFVKQSGGHIKIYSEQGYGTTIKVYLPRSADSGGKDEQVPLSEERGNGEAILVVEDEKLVRDYLSTQLRSLGYRPHAVASATEALAFVDTGSEFDLLLTDVILKGGINGKELSDEVARRRPGTKVLFTSGYTENAIGQHGRLDPGGIQLLSKPYRKNTLARYVKDALSSENRSASERFQEVARQLRADGVSNISAH